ncbi:ATP-binding protein [Zavarzinia sp. CC-PAN008]|uniref:ATP-binding protein n=1 Tax=Zavarzinia sp. CC-PAN008 TaxID=3243332 RepID=UPI003F747CA5
MSRVTQPDGPEPPRPEGQREFPGWSLRAAIFILCLATLLPAFCFATWLAWSRYRSELDHIDRDLLTTARTIAILVDRDLGSRIASLDLLASYPSIVAGDLVAFGAQAQHFASTRGVAIALVDDSGIVATWSGLPGLRPAPPTPSQIAATLARQPQAPSDLVAPAADSAGGSVPHVVLAAPIPGPANARRVLAMYLPAKALLPALQSAGLGEGWTGALIDNTDLIVAHTRLTEGAGRLASADLRASTRGESGTWVGLSPDGRPVAAAFQRTALAGWRSGASVPFAVVRAALDRFVLTVVLAALGTTLVCGLLAWLAAHRITEPFRALVQAARTLGAGGIPHAQPAAVREITIIQRALVDAGRAIQARVAERDEAVNHLREETGRLRIVNDVGGAIAAELDVDRLVQSVTDAGVSLTGAAYGAFFYNAEGPDGVVLHLHALSGAPRQAFSVFPPPRMTGVFAPTFQDRHIVRSDDITQDPRFGLNAPNGGMPPGHLPVRSYLAIPVVARTGEAMGGLLFGHPEAARFEDRHETVMAALVGHVVTALDNARLFQDAQREIARRAEVEARLRENEERLKASADTLEVLVEQRTAALHSEMKEREKAEAQLRQAQKMEALGSLTGGIAHDFNNMLQVILGRLERMRRDAEGGRPAAQRDLDAVQYAADRAANLTHRLLAFARQQPLKVETVDINRLVTGMSDLLRQTLGEAVAIETVLAGGLWRSAVDPHQLENAILNLAVNARDAMPGGGRLTIETANAYLDDAYAASQRDLAPGQYVMVAITDTGSGMAPEVAARAFDPFYTTKPPGQGTGLGLSMVYGFASQSHGHVRIYSEVGEGTSIKLYVPRLYEGAAGVGPSLPHRSQDDMPVARGQGETILVVEDEDEVRQLTVATLRELGYRVIDAPDAEAGLAVLGRHPEVALLLTDVVLPGALNGREMADRALQARPDLRVLFMTGYTRNAIVHHGRLDPGVELITKPFGRDAIASKLRRLLDRS